MIKYLVMDVDGSLTDGKIYMGPGGEAMKAFSIKDGYAINTILKENDIVPIVLTARTSSIVQNRCEELGIKEVYQSKRDKLAALGEIVGETALCNCAYFGDDIIDLKCMAHIKEAGGIAGCPSDAAREVKAVSDYVSTARAGEGALREFAEWLVSRRPDKDVLKQRIEFAIQYIKDLDKDNMEAGIYPVNDFLSISVQEYDTKDEKDCVTESHRKYIDVQWIVKGEEAVCVSDISRLQLEKEYSEEKDIAIWKPSLDMMEMVLSEGSYAVFYPEHAHKGCIAVNSSARVKKIVGKVKID